MKKTTGRMRTVLVCVILVLAFCIEGIVVFELVSLRKEVEDMSMQLMSVSDITNETNSKITSYIDDPNSLLMTWRYGRDAIDIRNQKIFFTFSVKPKKGADVEAAVLLLDGRPTPMQRMENGEFTATEWLPASVKINLVEVSLQTGAETKTESLDLSLDVLRSFLPSLAGEYSGNGSLKEKNGENIYKMKGNVSVYMDFFTGNGWKAPDDLMLIMDVNGQTVKEVPISKDDPEVAVREEFTVTGGGAVTFYLTATDELGNRYRTTFYQQAFDENGEFSGAEEEKLPNGLDHRGTAIVWDKQGKELYRDE